MAISETRRKIDIIRAMRERLQEQFEIAEAEGFEMLAYLLDMALLEADTVEATEGARAGLAKGD